MQSNTGQSPFEHALASIRHTGRNLDWPVGLRSLPPREETQKLLRRIDEEVNGLSDAGPEADAAKDLSHDVTRLRRLFDDRPADTPITADQVAEAKKFLRKLELALPMASSGAYASTSASGQEPFQAKQ
jgi:hypothetical protein